MANKETLSLGLDVGTSGVRGICINDDLDIIASAKVAAQVPDREFLRNPQTWKEMLTDVLGDLGQQTDLGYVSSISTAGQSGTILLCDDRGVPLGGRSLLYNDTPAAAAIAELTGLVGCCPPSLGRAYELWSTLRRPTHFHVVHQADWIAGLFCGRFDCSDENNALKTGYSPSTGSWGFDVDALPFAPSALPKVSAPARPIGVASTDFSKGSGLSDACRILTGTTDGMAGFVAASGLKDLSPGMAVTSLGTTLVIKIVADRNIEAPEYGVYSHKLFDVWVAGGASNTGAGALLEHFTPDQLAALSGSIDPAIQSPLNYYPLIATGERFPVNNPNLTTQTQPRPPDDSEFLAGLLESIARIERQGYEVLDRLGAPYPRAVKTVGGGSANRTWTKIRERVLGLKIVPAVQTDAAYGAALMAQFGGGNSNASHQV